MDNQVFYRKWRPFDFDNVVGQNHITSTLKKAILSKRIAHAYLFTGPRGVGKTSTARILAKALNSQINDDGNPIIESEISQAIDEGRYLDLVEIDAASNRRIDDVRELLDSVQIQPTLGKYKIYIIERSLFILKDSPDHRRWKVIKMLVKLKFTLTSKKSNVE